MNFPFARRFLSTKNVLVALFVLVILIPYTVTCICLIWGMHHQLGINAAASISSDLKMMRNSLDAMLQDTERVSYLHLVDSSIAAILQKNRTSYDYQYFADEKTMQKAIMHTSSLNSNILTVTFFSLQGDTYCLNQISDNQTVRHAAWLQNAIDSPDHTYVAPLQTSSSGKQSLPLVYALYNSQCTKLVGHVQIDYDIAACLQRAVQNLKTHAHIAVWQGDTLILDSGSHADPQALVALTSDTVGQVSMHGVQYTAIWSVHAPSGLTVAVYQAQDAEGGTIMRNIYFYLCSLAVMLILAISLGVFVLSNVGNSIKQLSDAVDRVNDQPDVAFEIPSDSIISTELNQLMRSYRAMAERLTQSTQQEYQLRLEQQRAMMRALENQVNPHFLYNSLNLIVSLTQLGETESIRSVALSLADVMRYCIKGGSLVSLEEELRQTGKYIFLMEKRFPDRLQIAVNTDPGLRDCIIPKLIFQPLIENSVKYGLDSSVEHLHVQVDVHQEGENLLMYVEDDGPGIDPDKLQDILSRIQAFNASKINRDEQNGSIGIFNVHARVFARYGAPYGVQIASCPGHCRVTVCLPVQRKPAGEDA